MASTYRYLSDPAGPDEVLAWFLSLPTAPEKIESRGDLVLFSPNFGALGRLPDGAIDFEASPIISLFLPKVRRGALWTVREVYFNSKSLPRRFPQLHKVNLELSRWLAGFERVHPWGKQDAPYSYYLKGDVRNFDSPVFALPSGLASLGHGRYFVGNSDTERRLDPICKYLKLRGVVGLDA
jgi:hypothetical protein